MGRPPFRAWTSWVWLRKCDSPVHLVLEMILDGWEPEIISGWFRNAYAQRPGFLLSILAPWLPQYNTRCAASKTGWNPWIWDTYHTQFGLSQITGLRLFTRRLVALWTEYLSYLRLCFFRSLTNFKVHLVFVEKLGRRQVNTSWRGGQTHHEISAFKHQHPITANSHKTSHSDWLFRRWNETITI